jgi:TRAP-type C4-dicarboxylate transport system substrate-binding protein
MPAVSADTKRMCLESNYDQVDHVKEKLFNEFAADFEKKGFVLLGFAEAGFVYLFSSVKMSGPEGFDPLKMWVWKGDPVAKTSLEAFGIKTFPLHVTDVNTGLETGMINAFYSPPLAAVAFQWYSKVRYMLDYPLVNSTGAFLIKKKIFEKLSKTNRKILREESRKFCDELVQLARKENAEALEVLKTTGIEFEIPTDQQINLFQESAQKIYTANTGKLYSRELYENVKKILQNYQK